MPDTPGVEGVVLRCGFLYGAGTAVGPGGDLASAVKAGAMPIIGDGAGQHAFIHMRDAASATGQAISKGAPGIYNIVDDEPAPQATWLPCRAELLGGPAPRRVFEEDAAEQYAVQTVYYGNQLPAASNAKARSELGLTLAYPSWRDGFRAAFGAES